MLKKLRRNFIIIMMSLLTVVLLVVLIAFNVISYQNSVSSIRNALEDAVESGPGGISLPYIGGIMSSKSYSSEELTDTMQEYDSRLFDELDSGTNKSTSKGSRSDSDSYIPVYCVLIDDSGSIILTNSNSVFMDSDILDEAVSSVQGTDSSSGELSDLSLYYLVEKGFGGEMIAFADSAGIHAETTSRILFSALVGAGAFVAFFLISMFLSKIAMRPIEEAWNKQQRFIADASHELKTPLTVILANTDIVSAHPDSLVLEEAKWLDGTREEAGKMQGLVQDLLVLAQTEPDVFIEDSSSRIIETVDFSNLVEKTILQFEAVAFESGIEFDGDITDGLHVKGMPDRLERVVRVLVDNACKYSKADDESETKTNKVKIDLVKEGNAALLTVANGGTPIPEEDIPLVFDRFFKSDRSRSDVESGFGLGLPIAKNIVEGFGGTIAVTSDSEQGTIFNVSLPLAK